MTSFAVNKNHVGDFMNILWIVNMVMPDLADHLKIQTGASGTWMIDISHSISSNDNIKLAIACVNGDDYRVYENIKGIKYYVLPGNGKNMLFYTRKYEKYWKMINDDFKPDIVHIHGTEYSHGLSFLRTCPDVKAIASIQGVLNRIKDVDYGELPVSIFIQNRTLRQNFHFNGEIEMHFLHKKNAKYETEILRRVNYINCVNTWDSALCKSINPKLHIFRLEYNLRDEFYNSPKWDINKIKAHSIFTNPGGTPLKGLHQLIKAISLLKNKYPDIHINVPGMADKNNRLAINGAYSKYISKLIHDTGTEDNITFLGRLSAEEMKDQMLSANVVVIPSAIEGTSLILREAMYIGCPCITSFRGGMADFIDDKNDGFLYDYQEYPYLSERIDQLFSNSGMACDFSKNAVHKAEAVHNRLKNVSEFTKMYDYILKDKV
jgi:glycosyltransferase involved in cell wall biosynthesis